VKAGNPGQNIVSSPLNPQQLTGREESHLVDLPCGQRLQEPVAHAFTQLQDEARAAGFELAIASGFRSYARQLAIWNGKARGLREVHDDAGLPVALEGLPASEKLAAILRYSAIPGTSRHHWGTDLDIFDAAAMPAGYRLELSPREVASGGPFDPLHCWLDERMAAGESFGFFRPYSRDRGGVAPERWHLSYAPLALDCQAKLTAQLLLACWDDPAEGEPLALQEEIRADLPGIIGRYVAVAGDWCPAPAAV
jgi:LAS superfamily LD-carboxypeptidase LdcB